MADVSRLPWAVTEHWDWQRHASCRGMNSELFFHPENERGARRARRVADAKSICAGCPVLRECRDWAHDVQEPYGVWGGESEDERHLVLRRQHRSQTPDAV